MPKPATPIKLKPRRCKYCKLEFVPPCRNEQQRTNAEAQKFCTPDHRKAYHLNGGMTFERLIEKATRKIGQTLAQDDKFIAAVVARLEKLAREIAQQEIGAAVMRMQLDPTYLKLNTGTPHPDYPKVRLPLPAQSPHATE